MALLGAPGLGKTHLGVSMLREVVGQGYTGLYARGYDFLLALKDAWAGRGRKAAEIDVIKQYVKPDLLVLDEIGVQYFTDAEETMFFQIIENRYGANKPTIIISNLGKPAPDKRRGPDGRRLPGNNQTKDIEDALGFRAFDRLMEGGGICLEFFGESYRRRPPAEVTE
jgi:DNA replication protein DnaC